ncbi:MAG: HEAT repeat domain-containing protein [Pirellulaceae bacterium]|nr:HEAT repeat domain-containing protein [Pirellulaceae bacterium]
MSIAVLNEVYTEVRRLAIAGSVVAPGDFRLKKLLDPLKKAGEKAPVFRRVADGVEQLIQSTEKTAANTLLELGALLTSILYTQGATGKEGEWADLPPSPIEMTQTQTSARVLKPLLEALTSKGSGRFEQIKSAFELGLFNDLRLVRPAIMAIDDSYSEVRELISDKVLPTFGRAILGELLRTYDPNGKAGHARRLKLLHRIAPDQVRELVIQALESSSKEVKVIAIECLGDSDDDLNYLLEQAQAKAKDVRAAALLSLGRLKHQLPQERVLQALETKDLNLLERVAEEVAPAYLLAAALQKAQTELSSLLGGKSKADQKSSVERLLRLIRIATARRLPESREFLLGVVQNATILTAIRSEPSGSDVLALAIERLSNGDVAEVESIVERREELPINQWPTIVHAARKTLTAARFFELFSPYVQTAKKKSLEGQRSDAVLEAIIRSQHYFYHYVQRRSAQSDQKSLDPRWLNLALTNDLSKLVYTLANVAHPGLAAYLSAKWEAAKSGPNADQRLLVAQAMVVSGHLAATGVVLSQLEGLKSQKTSWYQVEAWAQIAVDLPSSAIPQLEVIIADPATNNYLNAALLEIIQTIRTREQTA